MSGLTGTVEANGLRFAYIEEGSGPLVLLLHGFPDTAYTWDYVRPRLAAKGYRAVSPFMRGYRPTAVPERDADSKTLAEDALALIAALGEKSAVVVGHDWGAATAYGAAALGPERVSKLVTVGIPHPGTLKLPLSKLWSVRHFLLYKLPGAPGRFAQNDFAALRAIYRRWSPAWEPADEEFSAIRECFADPASLDAAFGYYRASTIKPAAHFRRPIRVPTVAFAGTDDPILPVEAYRRAARMFSKGYTVEEMPGGHFMHREHPERFTELLLKHL